MLTLGLVPGAVSLVLLAILQCAIGLGLISGKFVRPTLLLLAFQMVGAASPLLLFPGEVFNAFPYAPTLEGQYIIKNIVLVSGGLVVGATVRGGGLTANPQGVEAARQKEEGEKNDPAKTLASSTRRPS